MVKNKRIISVILLVITIITLIPEISLANDRIEVNYKRMLSIIEELGGLEKDSIETPVPHFDLSFSDGQEGVRVEGGDMIYDHIEDPNAPDKVEIVATVPVGTVISAKDTSDVGSGSKIEQSEWQSVYRDLNNEVYDGGRNQSYTKDYEIVADKPGYINLYHNIADDFKVYYEGTNKLITFNNWSNKGNWRTPAGNRELDPSESGNNPYRLTEWFFTTTKIKVVEEGKENLVTKKLELVEKDTGKVIDSFYRDIDPLDPFSISKQKMRRTTRDVKEAPEIDKDKDYLLRSSYQFISFKEGEFDTSKPETMTEEQRNLETEIGG